MSIHSRLVRFDFCVIIQNQGSQITVIAQPQGRGHARMQIVANSIEPEWKRFAGRWLKVYAGRFAFRATGKSREQTSQWLAGEFRADHALAEQSEKIPERQGESWPRRHRKISVKFQANGNVDQIKQAAPLSRNAIRQRDRRQRHAYAGLRS